MCRTFLWLRKHIHSFLTESEEVDNGHLEKESIQKESHPKMAWQIHKQLYKSLLGGR